MVKMDYFKITGVKWLLHGGLLLKSYFPHTRYKKTRFDRLRQFFSRFRIQLSNFLHPSLKLKSNLKTVIWSFFYEKKNRVWNILGLTRGFPESVSESALLQYFEVLLEVGYCLVPVIILINVWIFYIFFK